MLGLVLWLVRVSVSVGVRVRVGVTFSSDDARASARSPLSPALFFPGEEDAG